MAGRLRTILCLAAVASVASSAAGRAGAAATDADAGFERWRAVASAATRSPVSARRGDLDRSWTAPDGRTIHLVVRLPHPSANAPTVDVGPCPAAADATSLFEAALAEVRRVHAGRLVIAPGTCVFRTLSAGGRAHLLIDGVSDLTIDGSGATLVFTRDATGIQIARASRTRLEGLAVRTAIRTFSFGRIAKRADGAVLITDDRAELTADDHVASIVEWRDGRFVHGGVRLMFPPGSAGQPVLDGSRLYRSARFGTVPDGTMFVVYHQWYGGVAIEAGSERGPDQAEDITLDHVRVQSAPGMGILAYGIRRGFAVTRSAIAPPDGAAGPLSAEYDGIHVEASGGDIVLSGNVIAGTGDDAINLNAPVFPAGGRNAGGVLFGAWSRFIAPGDPVAFFDADDHFVGTDRVASVIALGGLRHDVTFAAGGSALPDDGSMRDLALSANRFLVEDNTIRDCNCHGLLVQDPDGLVEDNRFSSLDRNAIRLLTSTGVFKEGIGAFDVIVRGNTIENTGPDLVPRLPWAAITAYGVSPPLRLDDHLVDADIVIEGNHIADTDDGCITVADAENVTLRRNTCVRTGQRGAVRDQIVSLNARNVLRDDADR